MPDTSIPTPAMVWHRVPVPRRFDIALVALLGAFYAAVLVTSDVSRVDLPFVIPWCVVTLLPLLWRSQAPIICLVFVLALLWVALAVLGAELLSEAAQFVWIGPLVALGATAARRPLRASLLSLAVGFASLAAFILVLWPESPDWDIFSIAVACGFAWGLGLLARRHHERIGELRARQERDRDAVQLERSKIAFDLNDIIRSAVNRMRGDAADARRAINLDRDRAIGALSAIEATGIEVMHELRRLLHVLHDDPTLVPGEPADDSSDRAATSRSLLAVSRSDVGIAVGAIAASIVFTSLALEGAAALLACVYFAVAFSVLVWRHRFPVLVFVAVIAAHAIAVVLFHQADFVWDSFTGYVPVLVALAAVAAGTKVWVSLPILLVAWLYLAVPSLEYPDVLRENLSAHALVAVTVWVSALLAGRRARQIAQLEADEEAAAKAVELERTRLAYELHDVVGHAVTVMVLQAAGAVRIMNRDPARAGEALPAIEAAGEEAAQELERFIGLLGDGEGSLVDPQSQRRLGLADLDDLVERIRPTVDRVEVQVAGVPGRLESSVDWAAYCVVREALANAVKHAGPEVQVDISISWADDLVLVKVASSHGVSARLPSSDLSGGYGLVSLRERVQVAGGELRWSEEGGIFSVNARFPLISGVRER
jgi:signal transduction histidine kinase